MILLVGLSVRRRPGYFCMNSSVVFKIGATNFLGSILAKRVECNDRVGNQAICVGMPEVWFTTGGLLR